MPAFSLALLFRLFNEALEQHFSGGPLLRCQRFRRFIGAALLPTAAVLLCSRKDGLRSSIFSDVIQAVVFILFLAWIDCFGHVRLPGNSWPICDPHGLQLGDVVPPSLP